jgi:hypothetical protein
MFSQLKPAQRWILILLISSIGVGTLSGCVVDRDHHDDPHWHDHDHDHDWH